MTVRLHTGDNRLVLPTLPADSVEACVTDPPYGLEFMGVAWDTFSDRPKGTARTKNEWGDFGTREHARHANERGRIMANKGRALQAFSEAWLAEVYRVLKPGAYLAAFGGTRTFHRLACAVEDSGFEIRDCLAWMYGSGFPKSKNLDSEWEGWGSALKPAWEPIILARKPLAAANLQANAEQYGTGALNVDGCRIEGEPWPAHDASGLASEKFFTRGEAPIIHKEPHSLGRWPANVLLDEEAAALLDAQTGTLTSGTGAMKKATATGFRGNAYGRESRAEGTAMVEYGDSGGASRFFYCAKADRAEREAGLYGFPLEDGGLRSETSGQHITRRDGGAPGKVQNNHPTVKPIALMRWLVRLVTPPNGVVLDPFMGSGSTGCGAAMEHFGFIGIDQHPPYVAIADRRIRHWGGLFADVEQVA